MQHCRVVHLAPFQTVCTSQQVKPGVNETILRQALLRSYEFFFIDLLLCRRDRVLSLQHNGCEIVLLFRSSGKILHRLMKPRDHFFR